MGLFSKLKELRLMISEVESNIYGNKQDYLEIYERNLQLEQEIEMRTRELNIANKRLLTLQNIWDMMNSSAPLQNVLDTIMANLQGELGYIHADVVRKMSDENGEYLQLISHSKDIAVDNMNKVLKQPILATKMKYNPNGIFADSLKNNKINVTRDVKGVLRYVLPELNDEKLKSIVLNAGLSSMVSIPLYIQSRPFGVFIVVSSRNELSETEKDFLMMFAKQIEMAITIADLFEAVKEQAVTDGLTGLYNRRYFEENLSKEVVRAIRQKQPFSIVGLDLDYLKQINDKFGHAHGDAAIKTVAEILKKNARSIDIAARMGGEEFNVLLPGIESEGALVAAERMRKAIEDCKLDTVGNITASIGVATFFEHSDNVDELLELTDQAMYQSKRDGRNRVTLAKPIAETSWQDIAVNTFIDILSKYKMPIPKDMAKQLKDKLKNSDRNKELPKEVLYSVSDILASAYNPSHSKGITKAKNILAVSLAKRFDIPKKETDNLRVAMLLHDIGNLMLPPEILQKTEPLTDEEKRTIQAHPIIAAREILKPISYIQDVIPIIEHHHENWDGTGYPRHKSKDEIPLTSQIVLIIDAYFALLEDRPYRSKLTTQEAIAVIKKDAGKKWNEMLVQEFVSLVEQENTIPVV